VWSNATVITRSTDADEYGPDSNAQLSLNDYFFTTNGNVNAGSAFVVNAPTGTITFGTSNISFALFSSSQTYTSGNGISIAGTVINAKVDNVTTAFDGGGNIVVKTSANLVTPNIGAATGTSLSVTGTVTSGNILTGGVVSAAGNITGLSIFGTVVSTTGNVTGGNILTAGLISATSTITSAANIFGGNLLTVGLISATSTITSEANITGGNILTAGLISSTGNATHGNILTAGQVSATGNITTAGYFVGTFAGSISGNVTAAGSNTQVQFNNSGNLAATSGLTFNTDGNILSVTGNVAGANILTAGLISATSTITSAANISGGNLLTSGLISSTGNVTGGNILTAGLVSATGNITGNFILGNGSQLTGIITSVSNVVNGGSNLNIATANANVTISVSTIGNVVVFSPTGAYVAGVVSVSGNVTGGNILTAGLISTTGTITSAANIAGANLLTVGLISATGNITGGNIVSSGIISTSGNIFGGGINSTSSATAPSSPSVGDFWYNTSTNVQYRYTFDGTNYYWIDDFGPTAGVDGTFNAITNGTSNVTASASANITVGVAGTANVVTWATTGQYVNGVVSATGNITAPYFIGNTTGTAANATYANSAGSATTASTVTGNAQANITSVGTLSSLAVTANVTGGNILTGGLISSTGTITGSSHLGAVVSVTGNVSGGNISAAGNITSILVTANNFITALSSITSSASNVTLTAVSPAVQYVSGSASQNIILPNATTLSVGTTYTINANSSQPVYIYYNDGTTLFATIPSGGQTEVILLTNGTTNGTWDRHSFVPSYASWGNSTLSMGGANITSTASASFTGNVTGGNITATGNITGGNLSVSTGTITLGNIVNANGNSVGNIGSSSNYFNTVFAKATSAQYADLAETYVADDSYSSGTLVIFGGADEITASTISHDTRVAGIISTAPAYLMNSGAVGLPVALTGRVPCSVVGTIRKGDRLVASAIKGVATTLDTTKYLPGCIIGKALENYNSDSTGVIEVAVGRY